MTTLEQTTFSHQDTQAVTRLVRKTAVDLVVDSLRSRIMSGELAPGSALRQEALSAELGVSRIPLREAIRLLATEGWIDLMPHKGAYVTGVSLEEARDLFDLRLRLEPWLVQEACPLITRSDLDQGLRLIEEMDSAGEAHWGKLNWAFHELLYRAAKRHSALHIVRGLHEKTERYLRFQMVNAPIRQQAHAEHLELINLCGQRLAVEASKALEHHISVASQQVLDIVSDLIRPKSDPVG